MVKIVRDKKDLKTGIEIIQDKSKELLGQGILPFLLTPYLSSTAKIAFINSNSSFITHNT